VTRELGFDACVDYKAGNLYRDLQVACPKGADVYFDNVGAEILDTMMRLMNIHSRIVVCGMIAEYSATQPYAMKNLRSVLVNRIQMQGMIVFDWKQRYGEALKALGGYFAQGRLKYRESVVEGLENAPQGLIALLGGQNFGKQLVKIG
jgi:NADPH-dependent curcumin reductase CurA